MYKALADFLYISAYLYFYLIRLLLRNILYVFLILSLPLYTIIAAKILINMQS